MRRGCGHGAASRVLTMEGMRIWIAAIGSKPREAFEDLARMYVERIGPYVPGGGKAGIEAPVFRSEEAFWSALERERARTAALLVMMDERGRQMSSEAFAEWLGRERDQGRQLVVFAIGPADGWSKAGRSASGGAVKTLPRAGMETMLLSLGPMTMAHELARVVIAEQVYRAFTILKGHPYHRN